MSINHNSSSEEPSVRRSTECSCDNKKSSSSGRSNSYRSSYVSLSDSLFSGDLSQNSYESSTCDNCSSGKSCTNCTESSGFLSTDCSCSSNSLSGKCSGSLTRSKSLSGDCSCSGSLSSVTCSGSRSCVTCSGSLSCDCSCSQSSGSSVKIPKKIMQTWKTKDLPDHWKISPISIKKHMPDWEYVLMTDKDNRKFVKKHFPDFLEYYDAFPHAIMRADAVRYLYLYIHGGIYIDLDFEMQHDLSHLFTSDADLYFVASGNVGSCITNSFMACKPRCKLWLDVIEEMKKPLPWYYLGKHVQVMSTTGPVMLNRVVRSSNYVYSMLPSKLLMPCNVCNIDICDTRGAYLKPLQGSSWISYDTKFYNFFLCKWREFVMAVVIILLLLIFAFILVRYEWI